MGIVTVAGHIDFGERDVIPILKGARAMIEVVYGEPGCIHYVWAADVIRPGRVWVYEEWESVETLAAHLVAQPYYDMAGYLAASGMTGASIAKYKVAVKEPIYDDAGIARAEFSEGR